MAATAKGVKKRKKDAKKGKAKRAGAKTSRSARTSDVFELYQLSVQNPEHEIDFLTDTFRALRGREALSLKEDFCGTGLLSANWVASHPERRAVGLDIDRPTLDWGLEHNVAPLGDDVRPRVELREQNVLQPTEERFDVGVGLNFSYFLFKDRPGLLAYFRAAHRSLNDEGVYFVDLYGGWESQQVLAEKRKVKDFTYVWDQAWFNPIDNHAVNHIHFRFKDGSEKKKAFTYDWRLWQLAEIVELLKEAGFRDVRPMFEDEDENDEGLGTYTALTEIENQPGWLCYVVAAK